MCGRSSLLRYASDGKFKQGWYVGQHFPPYPLVTLAVRGGIATPELWIATEGTGVLVYDGQLFKNLLPAAIGQRKISALLPLSDGRVLLGTASDGLYVTDGKRLDTLHLQFARTEVTALAGDEGELWVGTRREGVWRWRSGEATHFQSELPDQQVLSIDAHGGAAWVGTPLGVAEFRDGQFRRVVGEGVFAQSVLEHSGALSIGTIDEGIWNVPRGTRLPTNESVVALGNVGDAVLAVGRSAVIRLPSGEPVITPPETTLSDGHVSALHLDRRGRLWIGYFDRGVDVMDEAGGRAKHFESDALFCVNRIKEDRDTGVVAVATANGLALFDSAAQLRRTLDAKTGLIANHVTDLLFHHNDREASSLAVATPAGVSFFEDGSVSSVSAFQGLVNNHVYTLADREGMLLVGTLGGFSMLRHGAVQASYTSANSGLRQNWITASVATGPDVYLGTYGSGVIRIGRDSSINSFRDFRSERVEINPNALLATTRCIYAGTAGQGLAVLRIGEERWQFVRDGLPSLNVTALAAHRGTLYVGTDNGLVRAAEEKLNP